MNAFRKVFSKSPYTSTAYNKNTNPYGNLITSNSDFSSGATGWTITALTTGGGANLYSFPTVNGLTVLQLDETTADSTGSQGAFSMIISIPVELRYSTLEFSMLISGYFQNFQVDNEDFPSVNINIDTADPMRLYYYYQPEGAATVKLWLYRCLSGNLGSGLSINYGQILVREATYTLESPSRNLPRVGSNMQIARWLGVGTWNEPFQENLIANYQRMGGMCRVWISSELFAAYTSSAATLRTSVSSSYFTTVYAAETTEHIPTGALDSTQVYYLDWFFNKTRQYGLKLHVCLTGGFTDSNGNPHSTLSKQGTIEFLDSDINMQNGFVSLYQTIVTRYLNYENIVSWELMNEGYPTWSYSFAGIKTSGTPGQQRAQIYQGYEVFEKAAYAAIKAIDPNRPVALNPGSNAVGQYFVQPDNCDIFTPSVYQGYLTLTQSAISGGATISPANGYHQVFQTTENGQIVYIEAASGATLPAGLAENTPYYIINVNAPSSTIQLSATLNGSAIAGMTGGVGTFYLFSKDGSSLAFADYIIRKYSLEPTFAYISEFGAPVLRTLYYRNDAVNSAYIEAFYPKLQQYGIASLLAFDEQGLMFNTTTFAYTAAGSSILTKGASSYNQESSASPNKALTDSVELTGRTKLSGNLYGPTTLATFAHLVGGTAVPVVAANNGSGTSPTISIAGSDLCFTVTLITGSSPGTNGRIFTVTLNTPFPSGVTPQVIMTPGNINAAQLSGTTTPYVNYSVTSNTTVVISNGTGALTAATTYVWTLALIQ